MLKVNLPCSKIKYPFYLCVEYIFCLKPVKISVLYNKLNQVDPVFVMEITYQFYLFTNRMCFLNNL